MTAEERALRIIKKANENGYDRDESFESAAYWFGTQQFYDHDFAKAYWGDDWSINLHGLLDAPGDLLAKLDLLEQFL